MGRTTIATVNSHLRASGIPGRLRRGRGYYWMDDAAGEPDYWSAMYSSIIEVYSISDLTPACVVRMIDDLRKSRMNQ